MRKPDHAVRCTLSRAAFADNRIFHVGHIEGEATSVYCWDADWKPAPSTEEPIAGYVQARVLSRVQDEAFLHLPGNEYIWVSASEVVEIPDGVDVRYP